MLVWLLLSFICVLVLVSVLGTITSEAVAGVHSWTTPAGGRPAVSAPFAQPEAVGVRTVSVTTNHTSDVVVTGEIDFAPTSIELKRLLSSRDASTTQEFGAAMVGRLIVRQWHVVPGKGFDTDTLVWATRSVTRPGGSGDFHVAFRTAPYLWTLPSLELDWIPATEEIAASADDLTATGDGWRVVLPQQVLDSDSAHISMTGEQVDRRTVETTDVSDLAVTPIDLVLQRAAGTTVADRLRVIGSADLRVGGFTTYYLVVDTLPLVVVLLMVIWAPGLAAVPGPAAVRSSITKLVVLSGSVAVLWLLYDISGALPVQTWTDVANLLRDHAHHRYHSGPAVGVDAVLLVAVVVGWPIVAVPALGRAFGAGGRWQLRWRARRPTGWERFAAGAGAAIVGVSSWFALPTLSWHHHHVYAVGELVAGYLVIGTAVWLCLCLLGSPLQAQTLLASVLALGLVMVGLLMPAIVVVQPGQVEIGARIAVCVMNLVLISGFAAVLVGGALGTARDVPTIGSSASRWLRRGIVAVIVGGLALFAAAPVLWQAFSPSAAPAYINSPLNLAQALDSASRLVVLLAILYLMYRVTRLPASSDRVRLKRWLAIVLAVETMYHFNSRWCFIPVTAILGAATLILFTFPRSRISVIPPGWGEEDWASRVTAVVRASRIRAKLAAKPKGTRLGSAPRRSAPNRGEWVQLFGVSREDNSWRDGLSGALVGVIIGTPWTIFFAVRYSQNPGNPSYPVLSFLSDDLPALGRWAVYGFLFGYAYPLVRGSSGVIKAMTLFVSLLLPALPLVFLWDTRAELTSYGLFCAEALSFFLLIGLGLGNIGLLRRAGVSLTVIFDLYRLPRLLPWTAATLAAVLTALATALGTAASGAVTSQLTSVTTTSQSGTHVGSK